MMIKKKIGQLGEVVGGATPNTKDSALWGGDIAWITPKDLAGFRGRFITSGQRSLTREGFESCSATLLPQGSVLFSSRAPIGYVSIAAGPLCTNQGFKSIVPNESIDNLFLYYLMRHMSDAIAARGSGTTFKEVSGKTLSDFEVEIPNSIEEQRVIAGIFGSLDSKIELNSRINDHLAEMAMMLFDSECPQTNEPNAVLSDVAEITMGQSPSGSSYNENGHGEVFYQGRGEFGSFFPRRHLFTTEPKRMAREGDILVSVRAPVGDLNIAAEDCCIGRGLAAIHSGSNQSFVHYLMRAQKRQLDTFNGDGTVFGSINGKALKELSVYLPSNDGIAHLQSLLEPIDAMIRRNDDEMQALEQLRDALLPKLMSGEIDISRIDLRQLNGHLFAGSSVF